MGKIRNQNSILFRIILILVLTLVLITNVNSLEPNNDEEKFEVHGIEEDNFVGKGIMAAEIRSGISGSFDFLESYVRVTDAMGSFRYQKTSENFERVFENLAEGSGFNFKDGIITEAHYSVTKATSYKIGNIEFFVPKDGKVIFKKGIIEVFVPKDESINQNVVQKIDRNSDIGNYEVIYKPEEGEDTIKVQDVNNPQDLFEIKNFKVGSDDKTDFGIGFSFDENGNKEIFIRGRATINDWYELGREGLKESIDTYLFFDGEMHRGFNKAYISINSDGTKLSLGNSKDYGPLLGFLPKNPIYPYEKGKKTLMIQPLVGAHMTISKRDGMIPLAETKGHYNIYFGDRVLRFAKGENIVNGIELPTLHKDFGEVIDGYVMKGTESIPLQVRSVRDDGTNLNLDYVISNSNSILGVKIKDWSNRQVYLTQDGQLVSIYDDYIHSSLTEKQQKILSSIAGTKEFLSQRGSIKTMDQLSKMLVDLDPDNFKVRGPVYTSTSTLEKNKAEPVRNAQEFSRKWGVSLNGRLSQSQLQLLNDIMTTLPPESRKNIISISIFGSLGGSGNQRVGGDATSKVGIRLPRFTLQLNSKARFGGSAGSIRHEIFHMRHYALGMRSGKFFNEWRQVAGRYSASRISLPRYSLGDKGFAWGYGAENDFDDVATFGDFMYQPSYYKPLLSSSNQYHQIYRGKIALLYKYNFITDKEYKRIFSAAGLDYGSGSRDRYISESKDWARRN